MMENQINASLGSQDKVIESILGKISTPLEKI
jgi:hypothetical protein